HVPEPLQGGAGVGDAERPLALATGQGRGALERRPPPDEHLGISLQQREQLIALLLNHEQRDDCRAVPELHRPRRRSSSRASSTLALGRGAAARRRSRDRGRVARRNSPARSRRTTRYSPAPAGPPASTLWSRALGSSRSK